MSDLTVVLKAWLLAALYVSPLVVAVARRHPRWLVVGWVDLLLGWTVVGWVAALVVALSPVRRETLLVMTREEVDRWLAMNDRHRDDYERARKEDRT